MADHRTLGFYTREAVAYEDRADQHIGEAPLDRFASALPAGGDVLDFGCGSGWAAAHLRDAGFQVSAIDGSSGLAAVARERYDLDVTVMTFDAFQVEEEFDGIWASFCLLHADRADMPDHLLRLFTALRQGGLLYLGLKEGTGSRRDHLDRLYTYFGQTEISELLRASGFSDIRVIPFMASGLADADDPCLHIFARRT